jgi:hypothetical protein
LLLGRRFGRSRRSRSCRRGRRRLAALLRLPRPGLSVGLGSCGARRLLRSGCCSGRWRSRCGSLWLSLRLSWIGGLCVLLGSRGSASLKRPSLLAGHHAGKDQGSHQNTQNSSPHSDLPFDSENSQPLVAGQECQWQPILVELSYKTMSRRLDSDDSGTHRAVCNRKRSPTTLLFKT